MMACPRSAGFVLAADGSLFPTAYGSMIRHYPAETIPGAALSRVIRK
ncbi:MAG: hypothetical protein WC586_02240 [Methanoregula sp.]